MAPHSSANRSSGGRFSKRRFLARGGLGEVAVAFDRELGREVALKTIRPDRDGRDSRQRFIREGRLTGGLEHPSIVPVYSLNLQEGGTPYYAMRLIDGESLAAAIARFHNHGAEPGGRRGEAESTAAQVAPTATVGDAPAGPVPAARPGRAVASSEKSSRRRHDASRRLVFRDLLSRFREVCKAMEYAHSRGVIHRDIKPGNIMLGRFGETFLVDWGLAKRIGEPSSEAARVDVTAASGETVAIGQPSQATQDGETQGQMPLTAMLADARPTHAGAIVGTPAYMSPEQAYGDDARIGPATDIYALGATLAALLTGSPPVDGEDAQIVLHNVRTGQTATRREPPPGVSKPLWSACRKAMAPAVEDRYQSAKDLADEVDRFLADEPLAAHLESKLARGLRWLRRHPAIVSTSVVAGLIVLAGSLAGLMIVSGYGAVLDSRNQVITQKIAELTRSNDALRASQAAEAARRKEAEDARQQAALVNQYLVTAFRSPGDYVGGRKTTVAEILDRAVVEARRSALPDGSRTELLSALAEGYLGLGLYAEAEPLAGEVLQFHLRENGEQSPETILATVALAGARRGRGQSAEAVALLEQCRSRAEAALGHEHDATVAVWKDLAAAYQASGRVDEAVLLYERVLDHENKSRGEADPTTVDTTEALAAALEAGGDTVRAVALRRAAYDRRRALQGDEAPATLASLHRLIIALIGDRQIELAGEMISRWIASAGKNEADVRLAVLRTFHDALERARHDGDVVSLLEQVHTATSQTSGGESAEALATRRSLIAAYKAASRFGDAIPHLERAIQLSRDVLRLPHSETRLLQSDLVAAYGRVGREADSVTALRDLADRDRAEFGVTDVRTLSTLDQLHKSCRSLNRRSELTASLQEMLQVRPNEISLDPQHHRQFLTELASAYDQLASAYDQPQNHADKRSVLEKRLSLDRTAFGEKDTRTIESMRDLANTLVVSGRFKEALPLAQQLVDWDTEADSDPDLSHLDSIERLLVIHRGMRDELAVRLDLEKRWQLCEKVLGADHPASHEAANELSQHIFTKNRRNFVGVHISYIDKRYGHWADLLEKCLVALRQRYGDGSVPAIEAEAAFMSCRHGSWGSSSWNEAMDRIDHERFGKMLAHWNRPEAGIYRAAYAMESIGDLLIDRKYYYPALMYFREALRKLQDSGSSSQQIHHLQMKIARTALRYRYDFGDFSTQKRVGMTPRQQSLVAEAGTMAQAAYAGLESWRAKNSDDVSIAVPKGLSDALSDAATVLADYYDAIGQNSEAIRWKTTARRHNSAK